jgi:hypothetical protein
MRVKWFVAAAIAAVTLGLIAVPQFSQAFPVEFAAAGQGRR